MGHHLSGNHCWTWAAGQGDQEPWMAGLHVGLGLSLWQLARPDSKKVGGSLVFMEANPPCCYPVGCPELWLRDELGRDLTA